MPASTRPRRSRPARPSSRRSRRTCTPTSCRARESWRSSGARVYTGPGADLEYDHHEVTEGETLEVGDVRLTFLHTPGHTWEHIAVLAEAPGEPARLFTGDLLFVGAVGRPDLARRSADARAGAARSSIRCSASCGSTIASRCIPVTARDRSAAPASARSRRRRSRVNGGRTRCSQLPEDDVRRGGAGRSARHAAVFRADEAREQGGTAA